MEKVKILIVEDTSLIAFGLQHNLEKFGYEITGIAASGEEALQMVTQNVPDLILMDIVLAGEIDGIETVELLQKTSKIPVLYLTGHADDQKIRRAKLTTPLGYVLKPYKDNQLRIIIEMALNKMEVDKELERYRNHLEILVQERTKELEKTNQDLKKELFEHQKTLRELKIAKEKAEESDRMKTAFLTNMSHEVRTPMNAIMGFSTLLTDLELTNSERLEYAEYVNNNAQILLHLIDDIIDVSRLESGDIKTDLHECNITELLRNTHKLYIEKLKHNEKSHLQLRLAVPPASQPLMLLTNQQRLQQCFAKILDNAIKFTEKGFIEFGYSIVNQQSENFIMFFVRDTGIGIPANKTEKIFERFLKIDDDTSKLYSGAGLGLTIARAIIRSLGGDIRVESELKRGSTFFFTHPIQQSENHDIKATWLAQTTYDWSNRTILVVEDEEDNYRYLLTVLRKTNVKTIWATDGDEAMQHAFNPAIDLILMDIKLPRRDGYSVTADIRTKNKTIPIIAQTAFALAGEREKCLAAGCNDYISKPLSPKTLLKIIDKYFGGTGVYTENH